MKSVRQRAQQMFERIFLKEQLKKKEYQKKQQQQKENEDKGHTTRDGSQPNIPQHRKLRKSTKRQRVVGTAPVAEQ